MGYSVGEAARLGGVTVRTLHHYDAIGLLRPGGRTSSGYRSYDDADLDRLQQVRVYRELGFTLEEVAAILDDPDADATAHLRRQREVIRERIARLERMAAAVQRQLEARSMGIDLSPQEKAELFGDTYAAQGQAWEEEAQQRWGETEAYQESQQRVSRYTKADWARVKGEMAAVDQRFVDAMTAGHPPGSEAATEAAEAHRQYMERWFYDCPPQMHVGLTSMYVDDERFRARYEAVAPGLAAYVRDAAAANARRRGWTG